jgi:hypothetical protein
LDADRGEKNPIHESSENLDDAELLDDLREGDERKVGRSVGIMDGWRRNGAARDVVGPKDNGHVRGDR